MTALLQRYHGEMGASQDRRPQTEFRKKPQGNARDAIDVALPESALHCRKICSICWLIKADQEDVIIPAEAS